jgi:KaiC/GvpD/RAD55 family RecA-like ATPase
MKTTIQEQPDARKAQSKPLLRSHQEALITLLCYSDEYGRMILNLVEPDLFEGEYKVIALRALDYWRDHDRAPQHHIADLLADIIDDKDNRRRATYQQTLMFMDETAHHACFNGEFVLQIVNEFIRTQKMTQVIVASAEMIESKKERGIAQVEELWSEMLRDGRPAFARGTMLGDTDKLMRHLAAREQNEFLTGIDLLDENHVVPRRGSVMVILGLTGHGKSWSLVHIGRKALQQRKKVLYVTLELSECAVQQRFVQNLMAVPRWDTDKVVSRASFRTAHDGALASIISETVAADFTLECHDDKKRRELQQKIDALLARRYGSNLEIKEFPMGTLSIDDLRGYLTGCEALGFKPDMLVVDYVGRMQIDSDNYRISLGNVFCALHALAKEHNVAVVTAQQASREGSKAARVTTGHVAEDWSIIGTADFVLTLTRSDNEKKHKLAQLWVGKAREDARDGFGVVLAQNYPHGQFVAESAPLDPVAYAKILAELDAGAE